MAAPGALMPHRVMSSAYMEWAKVLSGARYNLASSDLAHFPLAELPFSIGDLEITGPGGYGYAPLTEAIARRFSVDAGCVVTTIGTSMANHLAMAALVERGDEVLIEEPTYGLILSAAQYLGARVNRFPRRFENGFLIDPAEVERAVSPRTRLVVVTNLHNPSSSFTDEPALRKLGEIARRSGARVLVDEVYLDAAFDRSPKSSIHLGDEFVVTNSLTKVYGLSGLRCGWILAEPTLARKIWRLADLFYSSLPHVAERLSVIALHNLAPIALRAQRLLEANAGVLNAFLGTRGELQAVEHKRGLTAYPRLTTGDTTRLCRLLREKYETSVVPGTFFGMKEHFRVGIGGETDILKEGLQRLGNAMDEISRG